MRGEFVSDGTVGEVTLDEATNTQGYDVRQCIEAALRRARVPAFRNEKFSVNWPIRMP